MPISADGWMTYPFWVDWFHKDWGKWSVRSDVASRPFLDLTEAEKFYTLLKDEGASVMLAERGDGVGNALKDGSSLFYFMQSAAESYFEHVGAPTGIKRGFGVEWRNGKETQSPVEYTPYQEVK